MKLLSFLLPITIPFILPSNECFQVPVSARQQRVWGQQSRHVHICRTLLPCPTSVSSFLFHYCFLSESAPVLPSLSFSSISWFSSTFFPDVLRYHPLSKTIFTEPHDLSQNSSHLGFPFTTRLLGWHIPIHYTSPPTLLESVILLLPPLTHLKLRAWKLPLRLWSLIPIVFSPYLYFSAAFDCFDKFLLLQVVGVAATILH